MVPGLAFAEILKDFTFKVCIYNVVCMQMEGYNA